MSFYLLIYFKMAYDILFPCRDEVRDVGDKITQLMNKKEYLPASKLLSSSLNTLHSNLQGIEALKQVQQDLTTAKEVTFCSLT